MNNNTNNPKMIEDIINSSKGKINKDTVNSAMNGDTSALLKSLGKEDREKLSALLSDKEKTKEVLSSDAAKKLMKLFLKDGKF